MKAKILSLAAALALFSGAPPANAYLQFVYSEDGATVLTVKPWTAFGPMSVYLPYPGSTNIYATQTTLTVSSGFAGFSGAASSQFNFNPPPVPGTQAYLSFYSEIQISDQIFDPAIPGTITTPFMITSPADFTDPIEINSYWFAETIFFDSYGGPTYDEIYGGDQYFIQADKLTISNVPEPSTWTLVLLGFAGLSFAGYRRASGQALVRS